MLLEWTFESSRDASLSSSSGGRWLFESLRGGQLIGKARELWKFAGKLLLWSLWLERNRRIFGDKSSSLDYFWSLCSFTLLGGAILIANSFVTILCL